MSDEMKEMPGETLGGHLLGAAPQSVERNAGGQASREENAGGREPLSGRGPDELSPTVGVPDPVEEYFSKMAATPDGLVKLQDFIDAQDKANLAEATTFLNIPGLTFREMKKIVAALRAGAGLERSVEELVRETRHPAPPSPEAQPESEAREKKRSSIGGGFRQEKDFDLSGQIGPGNEGLEKLRGMLDDLDKERETGQLPDWFPKEWSNRADEYYQAVERLWRERFEEVSWEKLRMIKGRSALINLAGLKGRLEKASAGYDPSKNDWPADLKTWAEPEEAMVLMELIDLEMMRRKLKKETGQDLGPDELRGFSMFQRLTNQKGIGPEQQAEVLKRMGMEVRGGLGGEYSMGLQYYRAMRENAESFWKENVANQLIEYQEAWIQAMITRMLVAHQQQEVTYEKILFSLIGSKLPGDNWRYLSEGLDVMIQSYGIYDAQTGGEGLEQATGRFLHDAQMGALMRLKREFEIEVLGSDGKNVKVRGKLSVGDAMTWMHAEWGKWGNMVLDNDTVDREEEEGVFIRMMIRKNFRDDNGRSLEEIIGKDGKFDERGKVSGARDIYLDADGAPGINKSEKDLTDRFIQNQSWVVKAAVMLHKLLTTQYEIDPSLGTDVIDGLKKVRIQPQYHEGYRVGVQEGRFFREAWHNGLVSKRADKLIPFLSMVELSPDQKETVMSKVTVLPLPVELQYHDDLYLKGKISLEDWQREREAYIKTWRDQGFKTFFEMTRLMSPTDIREMAGENMGTNPEKKELWRWSEDEKRSISGVDFRRALDRVGVDYDSNKPETYMGYEGLKRCAQKVSYENYTWEKIKRKDGPKYMGKYMEKAAGTTAGMAEAFKSLTVRPLDYAKGADFLERRKEGLLSGLSKTISSMMSYQTSNAQLWGAVSLIKGLVICGTVQRKMRPLREEINGTEWASVPVVFKGGDHQDPDKDESQRYNFEFVKKRVKEARPEGFRLVDVDERVYVVNGQNQVVYKVDEEKKDYCPLYEQYKTPPLDFRAIRALIAAIPNAEEGVVDNLVEWVFRMVDPEKSERLRVRLQNKGVKTYQRFEEVARGAERKK